MTHTQDAPASSPLVPGAHRVIRVIDSREGPYSGALVTSGDSVAVRMPAEQLRGWAGWRHAGAVHVAGPVDLLRRADGQDVLLPWCTESVSAFIGRRRAAGVMLANGEVGTLVGSLLRGLGEMAEAEEGTGNWWLTDQGRPVFAFGVGSGAREGASEIIAQLLAGGTDRTLGRVLEELRRVLEKPRAPLRQLQRWEDELFEIAAPQPLRRELYAPERARDIVPLRVPIDTEVALARPSGRLRRIADGAREVLGRLPWTGRVEAAADGGRREGAKGARARAQGVADRADEVARVRRPKRRVIVAGAAAGVVLCVGLLWPSGGEQEADALVDTSSPLQTTPSASPPTTQPEDAESEDAEPVPTASEEPSDPDVQADAAQAEPLAAARVLLEIIRVCGTAGDLVCGSAVTVGADTVVERLSAAEGKEASLELVDEYGGVAVIRVTPSDEKARAQMLVLVRIDENWLVRDVYDVANQPA